MTLSAFSTGWEVYETVQAVAARIPDLKREQVFQGIKTSALGAAMPALTTNLIA